MKFSQNIMKPNLMISTIADHSSSLNPFVPSGNERAFLPKPNPPSKTQFNKRAFTQSRPKMVSQRQRLARKRYREENPELFPKPEPTPPKDPDRKKKKTNSKFKRKKADSKAPNDPNKPIRKGFKKHPLRVPGMKPGESCFICRAQDHIAKFCPEKAQWERNKVWFSALILFYYLLDFALQVLWKLKYVRMWLHVLWVLFSFSRQLIMRHYCVWISCSFQLDSIVSLKNQFVIE